MHLIISTMYEVMVMAKAIKCERDIEYEVRHNV